MKNHVEMATVQYEPFGGSVTVYGFGRPYDWSIVGEEQFNVRGRIGSIANKLSLERIYAPKPSSFNGLVCDQSELQEKIPLSESNAMMRGCDADGVPLTDPKDALWISSADCVTIVAFDPLTGIVIPAHGGRDSLLNRARIAKKPCRDHESVVDAIAEWYPAESLAGLKV